MTQAKTGKKAKPTGITAQLSKACCGSPTVDEMFGRAWNIYRSEYAAGRKQGVTFEFNARRITITENK